MKYAECLIWTLLGLMLIVVAAGNYPPLAEWISQKFL